MLGPLSLKDRIIVLLIGATVLGSASSGVSIWALDQVARRSQVAVTLKLEVSETLGQVAAGHLQQTAALERALWEPRPEAGPSAGERRFEARAATIWEGLQQVRGQLSAAPGEGEAAGLLPPVAKLDAAHNLYAARAREAFSALNAGNLEGAKAQAAAAEAASVDFQAALDEMLAQASESAHAELTRLREEEKQASLLVGLLTTGGILGAVLVLFRAMHLVSRVQSLSGLLPICAQCKSIRDDRGYWNQLELFVEKNSDAQFTHGLCEPCVDKLKAETKA
ncbi:MAG: hypothetical protein GY946_22930 [bacterium]|nr:hypothetical protein [bacterium]